MPPARSVTGVALRHPRASRWVLALVVIAGAALLPEFAGIGELTRVQQILFYIMIAFGLNIGLGFAGEFAVAQPVIMGVSAYTAGIMSARHGVSPWLTLPGAVVAGCLIGALLSAPGFRLRGWYLAITTFFAAVVFPDIVDLFSSTTGGTNGLAGVKPLPGVGLILGSSPRQYWILLAITLVLMLGTYNLSRSTWGVILRGIRDAPLATEACGINVALAKAFVSIVASLPVALAGWTFAHASGVISTDSFSLNLSIVIVAGVVLGGMGTVWGPVIGTVIVEIISLWIGPFSNYNNLLVGGAVVFFAVAMPRGLVQAWSALTGRLGDRLGWRVAAPAPKTRAVAGETVAIPPVAAGGHPGDVLLEVRGIHKHFAGVTVLEGVDLTVRRGEVVGLIGPNGSGKTTLLNVITGHVPADRGEATLLGRSLLGHAPHTIAAHGVRRTFQVPRLIGELSAIENIRLGLLGAGRQEVIGSILQLPGHRARARRQVSRISAVCDLVGLDPTVRELPVESLPLGTRRVVEVARAVVGGSAVVCLDEPGAGLGGEELVRLGRVVRRVADAGSGIVVIEHNLDFVRGVTDRVVEMQDGRVVVLDREAAAPAAGPVRP